MSLWNDGLLGRLPRLSVVTDQLECHIQELSVICCNFHFHDRKGCGMQLQLSEPKRRDSDIQTLGCLRSILHMHLFQYVKAKMKEAQANTTTQAHIGIRSSSSRSNSRIDAFTSHDGFAFTACLPACLSAVSCPLSLPCILLPQHNP